ncbi:Uncharacterised protein [Mycobacteroides abscessus subsp. abscessus]|uniref:hypothetical protein n=1 Tax=Mycobacteroides abscessus TaxID=36809 RepID=UPI0009283397|nr:hypothetical protein [Mycobacteroides abscessus]SHU42375.1 Uncharacterised protein [Mycobacteroides abscessus subsp. abscessus]SHV13102.1 Uncharacterised protein [Mycobacteroides abscessus subsp. abscessus]
MTSAESESRHKYHEVLESLREHVEGGKLTPEQEAHFERSAQNAREHREGLARMTEAEREAGREAVRLAFQGVYSDTL